MQEHTEEGFQQYLLAFADLPVLSSRVSLVLNSLPAEVQQDFLDDTTFRVTLEEFTPEKGWTMFMELPSSSGGVSRCVVLRKKLERAPDDFALYVIAHEFAHAYLRNGGWNDILDKEEAADALAASWGYHKPALRWF